MDKKTREEIALNFISGEVSTAMSNMQLDLSDYETSVDLFDARPVNQRYEWSSNISIPAFATAMLTLAANDAGQYFQGRDYVEVVSQDASDEAKNAAAASKELINRTLNLKHLHYYSKYMRARKLTNISGRCYALCWWEKERKTVTRRRLERESLKDIFGNPSTLERTVDYDVEVLLKDRFNFDIIAPSNVFVDNTYTYSLQDKDFVTIRYQKTLEELKAEAEQQGYTGLKALVEALEKQPVTANETETSRQSYNKNDAETPQESLTPKLDVYERYGKFWSVVRAVDDDGTPITCELGLDDEGKPIKDAEFIETIMTYVELSSGQRYLLRHTPTPFLDANNRPYRPILRGLCYIHPAEDGGVGDGRYARDLQSAINDTFNVGADRTLLATMPVFKARKQGLDDFNDIRIAPNHVIELIDPTTDLQELKIDDDITGTLNQLGVLTSTLQQALSVYPTTMGQIPSESSTSATAIAGAEQRSNLRFNYKSMTFEHTFLNEMYCMIEQMTARFAEESTKEQLMGDKAQHFRADLDYMYSPVSANIETEFSKANKVKAWSQVLGYIGNIQHPDTVKLVNYVLEQIFTYMGDEYQNFAKHMLNPGLPINGTSNQMEAGGEAMMNNQFGVPMSPMEARAREGASTYRDAKAV